MARTYPNAYFSAVADDTDKPNTRAEDERILRGLREEIGARVRPFVAHLDEASVDELIDRMARIRFKYDGAGALRHTPSRGGRRFEL